jgi:GAF domain-containing protein/HAMP domain-containing protein
VGATRFSFRASSLKTRILFLLLVIIALAVLVLSVFAISTITQESQSAQITSSTALRSQARDYLIQITQTNADERDLNLEQIRLDAEELAGYLGSVYSNSANLDTEAFFKAEEHINEGPDGQYSNSQEEISSVFVPAGQPLTNATLNDVEISAYLDLVFESVFENNPSTVAIYFATPRNVVRYYPNIGLGEVLPPDFEASERPWYLASMPEENPAGIGVWSPVYVDATGRGFVTTASAPVLDEEGRLLGVLGIDITLSELTAAVENTQILQSGYSFLIDDTGQAIALSSEGFNDLLGREMQDEDIGINLAETETEFSAIIENMMAGDSGFDTITMQDDEELFVAYAPLESTGWSLASVVGSDEVLREVSQLQAEFESRSRTLVLNRILPIAIITFILVAVVAYFFLDRLVSPLQKMAAAAQSVGDGQWETELPIERKDEIGTLAKALNEMTQQVRNSISGLEVRVAERAQDLERQSRQMQTTSEIARISADLPSTHEFTAQAVDLIQVGFGFYHVSIYVIDETHQWAILSASTGEVGMRMLARRHRLAVGSASMVGWASANLESRFSPDVEKDPFHLHNPLLPETRSEAAVPMLLGDRVIGVIDVQSQDYDAFGPTDLQALQAIAAEMAIAIDNSRLLRETQAELKRSEAEYHTRTQSSWGNLFRTGSERIIHLGTVDDDDAQALTDLIAIEAVQRSGEVAIAENGRVIVVPITVRGEVVATISARKPVAGERWDEEEVLMLEAVAGQTGLALETARQYTEEQRRVAELEVLNRISQAVSQMLQLKSLYRVVHVQINQVLGDTDMMVVLYEEETDDLHFAYVSEAGELKELEPIPLGDDPTSTVVTSRQPILLLPDSIQLVQPPIGSKETPRSWLGVPMLVGDQVIGVIIVKDPEREERYSEEDVALLSTIASQVATAIQNMRLIDQVQRTARRERLIHEITSKVRRSQSVRSVLETTAREVGKALQVGRAAVSLGDGDQPDTGEQNDLKNPETDPTV